jgi:hypothetical protein
MWTPSTFTTAAPGILLIGIDYRKVKASYALSRHADFCKPLTIEALRQSQFPDELTDEKGTFRKPDSW